jgi:hypothetical protein
MKKYAVTQPSAPEEEIPIQLLATAILKLGNAAEAIQKAGLNRRAIEVLLQSSSGQSRTAVRSVLDALMDLKRDYLAPEKGKRI